MNESVTSNKNKESFEKLKASKKDILLDYQKYDYLLISFLQCHLTELKTYKCAFLANS